MDHLNLGLCRHSPKCSCETWCEEAMEIGRKWRSWCLLLGLFLFATAFHEVKGDEDFEAPSQCKPFIEKALKEQHRDDTEFPNEPFITASLENEDSEREAATCGEGNDSNHIGAGTESQQDEGTDSANEEESAEADQIEKDGSEKQDATSIESLEMVTIFNSEAKISPPAGVESTTEETSVTASAESMELDIQSDDSVKETEKETTTEDLSSLEVTTEPKEQEVNQPEQVHVQNKESDFEETDNSHEKFGNKNQTTKDSSESIEDNPQVTASKPEVDGDKSETAMETHESIEEKHEEIETESVKSVKEEIESVEPKSTSFASAETREADDESKEKTEDILNIVASTTAEVVDFDKDGKNLTTETTFSVIIENVSSEEHLEKREFSQENDLEKNEETDAVPEEDLIQEIEKPIDLRSRAHIEHLLKLDDRNVETEKAFDKISETTLKDLKKLYENAIKPLETLYKYRDLSNRHYGDSEIFSKALVVFMGPWSGGKSSIINYLLDNEYNSTSLRTGAEPSPAYFNLLMHGNEPEVLDGTQLAADFTFSGLQKFGQGLEERLRGLKLPSKLLEKVNMVEIPGILEVRKQISRAFPFNDACQWFIDRADIIFLVYDPSKLDVGPETEAILDQLKGREHQTRIVLNKADQVKPEELMRVQSALIWNISPLMSSAQPPIMYTTSLWSRPYESWAPIRLLQAQEREFLKDFRLAIDKRIENKISNARRFAVRVRNHAKMVDCYLTTYYNHKTVFGNRKQVADQIIEHPHDYQIYEGLSTLTNISRYDLPDPDVYRDFFRLNSLYDFQQLSATCTYFRGCPINRLDIAIAYDLPELVGKYKKLVETALSKTKTTNS